MYSMLSSADWPWSVNSRNAPDVHLDAGARRVLIVVRVRIEVTSSIPLLLFGPTHIVSVLGGTVTGGI